MKHLKMLGLAAIAALGLLALVGVGAASATTLFTDTAKTTKYPAGTTVHLSLRSGTSTTVKSGDTTIATCTQSAIHGSTQNEAGLHVVVSVTSLTWSGCSQTTHTLANGALDIEWTSEGSGAVIGTGNSWTLGIFGTSCTYGTGEWVKLGTFTGGSPAVLKINALIPRIAGGFLCPSPMTWTAEYVVTSPHALYVGA